MKSVIFTALLTACISTPGHAETPFITQGDRFIRGESDMEVRVANKIRAIQSPRTEHTSQYIFKDNPAAADREYAKLVQAIGEERYVGR